MATLTIHHTNDLDVVHDIARLAANNGADPIDATRPGVTIATFPDEDAARTVMATLAHAATVTGLTLNTSP